MILDINEGELAILKALVASVVDSNIGIECLYGYSSTKNMSEDEIQEHYSTLQAVLRS